MQTVPTCIHRESATGICQDQQCNKPNPFICASTPQCRYLHNRCAKMEWIQYKKILDQYKFTANSTFEYLCSKMEKTIIKGIEVLKSELDRFYKWRQQYGVVEEIAQFYQSIQQNREVSWTGKQTYQLKNNKKQTKFDKLKFDQNEIKNQLLNIEAKQSQLIKMIRASYQPTIIIKQKYLHNLNKRLYELKDEPENLELKFCNNKQLSRLYTQLINAPQKYLINIAFSGCIKLKQQQKSKYMRKYIVGMIKLYQSGNFLQQKEYERFVIQQQMQIVEKIKSIKEFKLDGIL